MIANTCKSVTFFASFFYQCVDIKEFWSSDNFNLLVWAYYSFSFWLLLALKLTTWIMGRGDMAGIKLERGDGWKNICKINYVVLC